MTKGEALTMLDAAPKSDKPSKVNKSFSVTQGIHIVRMAVESLADNKPISDLMEKRVYQVCRNQR